MCVIVDSCLCIDLRVASYLTTLYVWVFYIINLGVNSRQLELLDEREDIKPFDRDNDDDSERAISAFVVLRIITSCAVLACSLVSLVGTIIESKYMLLPYIISQTIGLLMELIISLMCWMIYWDEFYIPLSTAWRSFSVPFYLFITIMDILLVIAMISLYGNISQGHALKPTMNYKMNNSVENSVGYIDAGPPPALVPVQRPPRELPALRQEDKEVEKIVEETLTQRSLKEQLGLSMSSTRSDTHRTNYSLTGSFFRDTAQTDKPFILSGQTISAINSTYTRN